MPITHSEHASRTHALLSDLYSLIEALDRRVPRLDRPSEARIAFDASALRERAVCLIHQIEGDDRMQ